MKKFIFFTAIIISAVFVIHHFLTCQAVAEFKPMDFHNYPVKEDQYVDVKISKPVRHHSTQAVSNNNTNSNAGVNTTPKRSNKRTKTKTKINNKQTKTLGTKIPNWVYDNTSSSDMYYNVISSNSVFFTYADCQVGKNKLQVIKQELSKSGIMGRYTDRTELKPTGSTLVATCSKTYKDGVCTTQNKSPYACKCAVHYLMSNCRGSVCVINAKEKRMVKINPNAEQLEKRLKEIRETWN